MKKTDKRFKLKFTAALLFLLQTSALIHSQTTLTFNTESIFPSLRYFIEGYKDMDFKWEYIPELNDYKILLTSPVTSRTTELYWAKGRFLPKDRLDSMDKYRVNLYLYPKELRDPSSMTQKELEEFRNFGSDENRKQGSITSPYFFDALYGTSTKAEAEKIMISMKFLNKNLRIHSHLKPIVLEVEKEIKEAAKTDEEVKNFIDTLGTCDGYLWRKIRDTDGKSFHSYGAAIDLMPKYLSGKAVYWNWEKQRIGEKWAAIPLKDRWIPPQKVIDIFEDHGFIWGGKWAVWDNMHFEYHPELILLMNGKTTFSNLTE